MSYSEFLGLNLGLLGNENSIKELTLILAADAAHLLNLGAALGKGSVVNAIEDELALDVSGLLDGGASLHLDNLVLLATEEVLDSDLGAVLGDNDVDGEMSVHKSHFVAEALSDTDDHVADRGFERVDGTGLLRTTEPDADADEKSISLFGALIHSLELTGDMREVLGHLTSFALDSNFPCIHCACNCAKKEHSEVRKT